METKVKTIVTDLDELCKEECLVIDPRKEGKLLQEIVLSLKNTMKENNLVSLSAPQIGYFKRVFCVKFGDNDYRTFVNPVFSDAKGLTLSRETCSSLPDKEYIIPRNVSVLITYLTPMGKIVSNDVKGKTAFVLQHCMMHLDGMTLNDIGLIIKDMSDENVLDMWDKATEEERDEVLNDYMSSLDIKQKDLEKQIDNDPELKQINDAIKFMKGVYSGEIQTEKVEYTPEQIEKLKEINEVNENTIEVKKTRKKKAATDTTKE